MLRQELLPERLYPKAAAIAIRCAVQLAGCGKYPGTALVEK
jgi:hypothetical protein